MENPAAIAYEAWRDEMDPAKHEPWVCLSTEEQRAWKAVADSLEENYSVICSECGEDQDR